MIQDFFNSIVAVEQLTSAPSGMGERKSYSTRIASLPCRLRAMSIREIDEFGKMTSRKIIRLYCSADTISNAIVEIDRVIFGIRIFQIKAINNVDILDRHIQIDLLEID